jgi:hypothetical protein
LRIVRDTNPFNTQSLDWVDLPNASTQITVHEGERWLVAARFSATSICTGYWDFRTDWCTRRILVGGIEAAPAVGTDFKWQQEADGPPVASSLSIDRSSGPLDPGTYPVTVQIAVVSGSGRLLTLSLDDWVLTVEAARSS